MFTETEIKLRITPKTADSIKASSLVDSRLVGCWQSSMILNQYYDTAERDLARAGVALRLRIDGNRYIQTFKHSGSGLAGLSVRKEWDWYLDSPELDTALIESHSWPAGLRELDLSHIEPIFRTDFRRTRGLLRWALHGRTVEAEVAIDQGSIATDAGFEPICELEIELREGPETAVTALALELANTNSLMPCDLSKSDRGYRLLGFCSGIAHDDREELWRGSKISSVVLGLGRSILNDVVSLSEHFFSFRDHESFSKLHLKLIFLYSYFHLFDFVKFRIKQFRELSSLAGRLLDESSHLSQIANSEGFDSGLASRILSVFIEEHLWGQLLIGFGDWLFSYELECEVQEAGNESFIDEPLESWLATEAKKTTSAIRLWHKKNTCKDGGGCAESELNPIYRLAFLVEYFDECLGINKSHQNPDLKEFLLYEQVEAVPSYLSWKGSTVWPAIERLEEQAEQYVQGSAKGSDS